MSALRSRKQYEAMADTLDDLPRILRAARISRGLTYREVAEQIGSTASHLCNLERGRVGWGTDLSARILRWLASSSTDSSPEGLV